MLVLSRKTGQQICIGDHIKITIVKTQGQNVRVGIEAPREVRVVRAELPPIDQGQAVASSEAASKAATTAGLQLHRTASRYPGKDTAEAQRRTQPAHPQRWTVASMRERVQELGRSRPAPMVTQLVRG